MINKACCVLHDFSYISLDARVQSAEYAALFTLTSQLEAVSSEPNALTTTAEYAHLYAESIHFYAGYAYFPLDALMQG